MHPALLAIVNAFISKKKIIGWVGAAVIVALAAALGMAPEEFKSALCGAELPKQEAPAAQPALSK